MFVNNCKCHKLLTEVKMKTSFFLIIVIGVSVCVFSCKKKEDPPSIPQPNPVTPSTLVGNLVAFIEKDSNNIIRQAAAIARFALPSNNAGLDPDSVSMNGFFLDHPATDGSKYIEWFSPSLSPFNCLDSISWCTYGSERVPAFTYTTIQPIPFIEASYISIDTISISDTVTIIHPMITASEINYRIDGFNVSVGYSVNGSSTGITFFPEDFEMNSFHSGMTAEFQIVVTTKETYSPEDGVELNFSNKCIVKKRIVII